MSKSATTRPTAHLLYGFVGAGKTTFAKQLEHQTPAVRFTHDEWMHRLYGSNPPVELFESMSHNVTQLIWPIATRILELRNDVILDFGFWTRRSRDDARTRTTSSGGVPKLYHIACPERIMRERVRERTADPPIDSLWINEAAFDAFKDRFEKLGEDEARTTISGTP